MAINSKLLEHFDDMVIEHPHFMNSVRKVLTQVQYGSRGRIMMVIGPTGVGKTTLIKYCVEKLDAFVKANPDLGWSLPLVLEAPAPETGEFSWKDFYIRALQALQEPGLDAKIDMDSAIERLRDGHCRPHYRSLTNHQLRTLTEQALRIRRPIAVFIDECQHLGKCKSSIRKSDNLDVIKSISNKSLTTFIQLGTYEARSMLYHGAQLSRRVVINHFARYSDDGGDGLGTFVHILSTIFSQYKLPIDKKLSTDMQYFYNHTLGCVGVLATWIRTAIETAIGDGATVLLRSHFEQARLTNIQLTSMARAIAAFESEHRIEEAFNPNNVFLVPEEDEGTDSGSIAHPVNTRRPGIRNPHRDPVGGYGQ